MSNQILKGSRNRLLFILLAGSNVHIVPFHFLTVAVPVSTLDVLWDCFQSAFLRGFHLARH